MTERAPTHGGPDAPYRMTPWEEVIRRLETELAAARAELAATRLDNTALRNELDRIKERLLEGNKTFAEIRDENRSRWKSVAGIAIAFAASITGWAYTVTAKPDTVEVRRMIAEDAPDFVFADKYDADRDAIRRELEQLKLKDVELAGKLSPPVADPPRRRNPGGRP